MYFVSRIFWLAVPFGFVIVFHGKSPQFYSLLRQLVIIIANKTNNLAVKPFTLQLKRLTNLLLIFHYSRDHKDCTAWLVQQCSVLQRATSKNNWARSKVEFFIRAMSSYFTPVYGYAASHWACVLIIYSTAFYPICRRY